MNSWNALTHIVVKIVKFHSIFYKYYRLWWKLQHANCSCSYARAVWTDIFHCCKPNDGRHSMLENHTSYRPGKERGRGKSNKYDNWLGVKISFQFYYSVLPPKSWLRYNNIRTFAILFTRSIFGGICTE